MKPAPRIPSHLTLCALALAALGCAHAPVSAAAAAAAAPEAGPRRTVLTGSRLPQAVDDRSGLTNGISPVRVYTREELQGTGRPELGAALQAVDPSSR